MFVAVAFGGLSVLSSMVLIVLRARGLDLNATVVLLLLSGAGFWMTRASSPGAGTSFAIVCGLLIAATAAFAGAQLGVWTPSLLGMLVYSAGLGAIFGSAGSLLAHRWPLSCHDTGGSHVRKG
jgi:hypothetical protein